MKRRVIIPTIALIAILGAVTIGTVSVNAQSPMYGNLVTEIAQRFNLKESDVQDVVNQVRTSQHTAMKLKWEERLSKEVTDGKITDAQKTAIIAKHDELQKQFDALSGLSKADRKAKISEIQAELKKWATDNGLDTKFLGLIGIGGRFGHGFKLGIRAGSK
jgi:hypothetical protein